MRDRRRDWVAELGTLPLQRQGFHPLPALDDKILRSASIDDRTDDCAFGAMMSLTSAKA
jgi:hypothetical protein